jgi:hypothetical protein
VSNDAIQKSVIQAVAAHTDNHLVAQGAVALLSSAIAERAEFVASIIELLPQSRTAELISEEIKWRLEFGC